MLQWLNSFNLLISISISLLYLIVILSLISLSTQQSCNGALATSRFECSKLNGTENNRCCLFTSGIEKVTSCYMVDMTTVATMQASVQEFKAALQDQENITFDCGSKMEECLQVKTPYYKTTCHKITEVENNQTCCLVNNDNDHSCYPLKAETIEDIDAFVKEYTTELNLNKTPSVICRSNRLTVAIISLLLIITLTLI